MIEPLHKNVLALVVGLGLLGGIAQAAELSTSDTATVPAGTLILPLTFASGTATISAIQFDIETDPELVISILPGESAQRASKKVYTAAVRPNVMRCILRSNQRASRPGALVRFIVVHVERARIPTRYDCRTWSHRLPKVRRHPSLQSHSKSR